MQYTILRYPLSKVVVDKVKKNSTIKLELLEPFRLVRQDMYKGYKNDIWRAWQPFKKSWSAVINTLPDIWKAFLPTVWFFATLFFFIVQFGFYTFVYPIWRLFRDCAFSRMTPLSL